MKASYELPKLGYSFDALEPVMSKEMLEVHYSKHHKAYVTNLNDAMNEYLDAVSKNDLPRIVQLQGKIKFNGGGHLNHSLFWENLAPIKDGKNKPSSSLLKAIERNFGTMEKLVEEFNKKALSVQGSGWSWLGYNKLNKALEIATTSNHDMLPSDISPLLIVDVWEHAYYLGYKNERGRFLTEIWKIINFNEVEKRLNKTLG